MDMARLRALRETAEAGVAGFVWCHYWGTFGPETILELVEFALANHPEAKEGVARGN